MATWTRPIAQRWVKVVNDQVKAAGGDSVGHPEWWGKRRFAYEINKKEEGYYVFFNVVAPSPARSTSWSATCASRTRSSATSSSACPTTRPLAAAWPRQQAG